MITWSGKMDKERTLLRSLALGTAGLFILFTTGCTQIPTRELSQYRDAFDQVQKTSEDILIDFARAREKAELRRAVSDTEPAPQPKTFSPDLGGVDVKQPDAIEVRRTAMRTIDTFNNVLVTLAEGKEVQAVRDAGGDLVQAAGKFVVAATGNAVPGLSAVSSLVQTFAGLFEKARERKEFEQAVRSGAPVIDSMLAALSEDRKDHMALRADEANQTQVDIMLEMIPSVIAVRDLFAARSEPSGNDPREGLQDDLNTALMPAKAALAFNLPLKLAYTPARPAFTVQDRVLVQQSIGRVKDQVVKYEANVAAYQNIRKALNDYGVMLEKTRAALRLLVASLDNPPNLDATTEDLYQIAFSVKRDIEAFRAAQQAAQ
jgi:hypothetical protein